MANTACSSVVPAAGNRNVGGPRSVGRNLLERAIGRTVRSVVAGHRSWVMLSGDSTHVRCRCRRNRGRRGRRGYVSKSDAKRDVRLQQTRGATSMSRAYRCTVGDCRLYHLTHQPMHLPE